MISSSMPRRRKHSNSRRIYSSGRLFHMETIFPIVWEILIFLLEEHKSITQRRSSRRWKHSRIRSYKRWRTNSWRRRLITKHWWPSLPCKLSRQMVTATRENLLMVRCKAMEKWPTRTATSTRETGRIISATARANTPRRMAMSLRVTGWMEIIRAHPSD